MAQDSGPTPLRGKSKVWFAAWTRADVQRAAEAAGSSGVAIWASLRSRAGARERLFGSSSPSIGDLAEELTMSVRTVQRRVQDLEDAGLLTVERPDGQKPVWRLHLLEEKPVENVVSPPSQLRGRGVTVAGDPRHSDTPVPPLERNRERREIAAGDDEIRKGTPGQDEAAELEQLVRRFSGQMSLLINECPGAPEIDVLEELVLDARDAKAWRQLVELAAQAIALSPHLQEADA